MILKIDKKRISIDLLNSFSEKIKSFRFRLEPIENGICFYKKRIINTYLFCQKVDIIFTDKNNKILKISKNTPSEKFLFGKKGTFYIYLLKPHTTENLEIGEILKISYTKEEKELLKNQ